MGNHRIPPDITLFGKLGSRSRAFPMVVTELVDNSLDSWIEMPDKYKAGICLEVDITVTEGKDAWFTIEDNAGGMTEQELAKALTVAHSEKLGNKKLLGSFGFGLKSAAMYIGSQFYIYTCSYKDPKNVWFVEFNRSKFEAKGEWEIQIESISHSAAGKAGATFRHKHGTLICIKNEKYRSAHKVGILNRLTRTFGPRLPLKESNRRREEKRYKYDPMVIRFNDDEVTASGPFYEPYKKPTQDFLGKNPYHDHAKGMQDAAALSPNYDVIEIPEVTVNGKRVYGRAGIMDRGMGHNNQYGFDLIKNGRVIETNERDKDKDDIRIGLLTSMHNARIVGQLFLDDWETDHQKTEFIKDSQDWLRLGTHVRKVTKPLISISFNLQNPQKRKKEEASLQEQIADEYLPKLGNIIQHAVRSEAVKDTLQKLESAEKKTKDEKSPSKKSSPKIPMSKEKKLSSTQLLFTKPRALLWNAGKSKPIVSSRVVREGKAMILRVALNLDHLFFQSRESAELKAIGRFLAVDSFAEYMCEEKGLSEHSAFIEIRDSLLTQLKVR